MSRPVDLLIGCCVLVEGVDWLFRFLVRLEEEKKGNTVAQEYNANLMGKTHCGCGFANIILP